MEDRVGKFTKVVEHDHGVKLTEEYGFVVKEDSKVLSFDYFCHPEYGNVLLAGDQVFFLKFWSSESLKRFKDIVQKTISLEMGERNG